VLKFLSVLTPTSGARLEAAAVYFCAAKPANRPLSANCVNTMAGSALFIFIQLDYIFTDQLRKNTAICRENAQ
jgi:hypothetical protein